MGVAMRDIKWSLSEDGTPGTTPISSTEAKNHAKITTAADDTLITLLIDSAVKWVEDYTGRQCVQATWKLNLDCFPSVIWLPRPPVVSVSSITYNDPQGDSQTLAASKYTLDDKSDSQSARIVPAYSESWPSTRGHLNDVEVTYVCGYGTNASDVPADIRLAMLALVSYWYKDREAAALGMVKDEMRKAMHSLLFKYKVTTLR